MDLNASFESPEKPAVARAAYVEIADMKSVNLSDELLIQYNKANRLLWEAETDEETPLGQKATTLNAIRAVLADIIKLQAELYNIERLKILESTLLQVLKEFPEVSSQFMERYRERLGV